VGAEELQSALRSATDAQLVYVRGISPDATYQFKPALIRHAAYEALLKSRRKEHHGRVARSIDEKFPLLKEAHSEVVARHWTEAGPNNSCGQIVLTPTKWYCPRHFACVASCKRSKGAATGRGRLPHGTRSGAHYRGESVRAEQIRKANPESTTVSHSASQADS
jgi:hypothetical protein